MADIDLILKDIDNQWVRENFSRIRRFVAAQAIFDGNLKFYEIDIPAAESQKALKHNLTFVPRDLILLNAEGDQNFYFHYDLFDRDNLYVTAAGPVVLRFLAGLYGNKTYGRKTNNYPFVPPTSGGGGGGGPVGDTLETTRIAGANLSALRAVRVQAGGTVVLADPGVSYEIAMVFGITKTAALSGGSVDVVLDGSLTDASFSGFSLNNLIYLGPSGTITQTPVGAGFHVVLGKYIGNNQIVVEIDQPIIM